MKSVVYCFVVLVGVCCATVAGAQETVRIALSVRNVVLMPYYYAKDRDSSIEKGCAPRSFKSAAIYRWPGSPLDMIMSEDRLKKALDGPYARSEGEKSLSINEVVDYSILRSLR